MYWLQFSDTKIDRWQGSESELNYLAEQLLTQGLLQGVAWRNVHALPHQIYVFELRNVDGYGARWVVQDAGRTVVFRGLLEPPMVQGHDKRWRH